MIDTAIILAGGKGTRLRTVVSNLPKPMAPVAGRPFLAHVLASLKRQGIRKVVLSVGYLGEQIEGFFGRDFDGMALDYAWEEEPLGTGGGIRKAFESIDEKPALVLNGDTLFDVPVQEMARVYQKQRPDLLMAVRRMYDFDRYGTVVFDPDLHITGFREKMSLEAGWINGGVYLFSKRIFDRHPYPDKFSFEKDVLEAHVDELELRAFPTKGYFIDIGIPEDYQRAQTELVEKTDAPWALFLDRDGVINRRIPGDYVRSTEQFEWLEGACEAITRLSDHFGRIFVVTNQQGIGKGLMTEAELDAVHRYMRDGIRNAGGRVDRIYFCPHLASAGCDCRKPQTGMALQAKAEFPEIDFRRSVLVGDSASDIELGNRLGMYTFLVAGKEDEEDLLRFDPPYARCASLSDSVDRILKVVGQ